MTIYSIESITGFILEFLKMAREYYHSIDNILAHLKHEYGIEMESDDKRIKVIMMRLQMDHKIKARPRKVGDEVVTQYQIMRGN